MMRTSSSIVLILFAAAGCAADRADAIPGLAPPRCTMAWTPYAVAAVEFPTSATEAVQLGLDLDGQANDGSDNQVGMAMASVKTLFAGAWAPQEALNVRLAGGVTMWVLEVGTCADGDEVRVRSARAVDADADGRLEIVERGLASVGQRGADGAVVTARGLGWLPVGTAFAGDLASSTDAWQLGLSFASDLRVDPDALAGRLGFGLNLDTPEVMTPLVQFFSERGGEREFAEIFDDNDDGVISADEVRAAVRSIVVDDLDVGDCDDLSCYAPEDGDGARDHASFGFAVHAARVVLE